MKILLRETKSGKFKKKQMLKKLKGNSKLRKFFWNWKTEKWSRSINKCVENVWMEPATRNY